MKQSVTWNDFRNAFIDMGRAEQFSRPGLVVLFEFLEQWEQETGVELELDVIGLCCEWYESTWEEIARDYGIEADEESLEEAVRDYLEANTIVAGEVAGGCVYLAF